MIATVCIAAAAQTSVFCTSVLTRRRITPYLSTDGGVVCLDKGFRPEPISQLLTRQRITPYLSTGDVPAHFSPLEWQFSLKDLGLNLLHDCLGPPLVHTQTTCPSVQPLLHRSQSRPTEREIEREREIRKQTQRRDHHVASVTIGRTLCFVACSVIMDS